MIVAVLDPTLAVLDPTLAVLDPTLAVLDPTLAVRALVIKALDPTLAGADPTLAVRARSALTLHARCRLKSWSDVEPPSTDAARGGAGWRARARCT